MQRVVLVEYDPTLREWCRLHLESQQYTVLAFDDVRPALESIRLDPPELVVVATDLPAAGAFAVAAAIRSNLRTAVIPLLFLVSTHDSAAFVHAISIEPHGVITKPLTRAILLEAVATRIGSISDTAAVNLDANQHGSALGQNLSAGSGGLLLDAREATILAVVLRNFVSIARAVNAKQLDAILRQFMSAAREIILEQGGWVVRADATGLLVLFEESPKSDRVHGARAIEAALNIVVAARRAKKWAESELQTASMPDLSVGCGVHAGEVVIARLSGSGFSALTIAGPAAELALRLDGRAKSLGWSIAVSESLLLATGSRFQTGRRASLTDSDHGVTMSISEVLGFNPGTARPGELPVMAEAREAILANTMLARLAGDVDQATADRTIMVSTKRATDSDVIPQLPHRRVVRRIGQGGLVSTFATVHLPTDRQEVVKTIGLRELPQHFVDAYLAEYRKLADLDQRDVVSIYEVERLPTGGYVATEFLSGGGLPDVMRAKLPVGLALNCLAQMCLALDAIHSIGVVHGALLPEHFIFRQDRVLVLADFNVTARVSDALGLAHSGSTGAPSSKPARAAHSSFNPRVDFEALGRILHTMLVGETVTLGSATDGGDKVLALPRLPLPLSPLQPCLDGLLGIGSVQPFERAEDVLVELLAVKEMFPFDIRHTDTDNSPRARESSGR